VTLATHAGICYSEYTADGQCTGVPQLNITLTDCCCSSSGRSWSDGSTCQPCPRSRSGQSATVRVVVLKLGLYVYFLASKSQYKQSKHEFSIPKWTHFDRNEREKAV